MPSTADTLAVKRYQEDPLNYHGGIMLGTGSMILDVRSHQSRLSIAISHHRLRIKFKALSLTLLQMMDTIQVTADKMTLPILLLQGEEDRICDPAGAKKYYEMLPSKDKKLILYPKVRDANLVYLMQLRAATRFTTTWSARRKSRTFYAG